MRAFIYHNEGDDHFNGWRPEHAGYLDLVAVYDELPESFSDTEYLEGIFRSENIDERTDRRRSLSIGDVVLLEDEAGQRAWACQGAWWLRLQDGAVRIVAV